MSTSTTQLFEGPTIEEALGAAVAEMGNDLEIIDAHKVRKRRRFSVRSDERFEVIAASRTAGEEEFEDVLRRMVDVVDEQERAVALDLRDGMEDTVDLRVPRGAIGETSPARWEGPDFVVQQAPPTEPAVPATSASPDPGRQFVEAVAAGAPDVAETPRASVVEPGAVADAPSAEVPASGASPAPSTPPAPTAVAAPATSALPAPPAAVAAPPAAAPATSALPAPPVAAPAPAGTPVAAGSVWSDDALADVGIPALVRERVTRRAPVQDLEWVAALADAIAEIAAEFDTGASNVELTGHGRASAVDLIAGLCRGMRIGDIIVDGVRIPATPVELALAVRARLQG